MSDRQLRPMFERGYLAVLALGLVLILSNGSLFQAHLGARSGSVGTTAPAFGITPAASTGPGNNSNSSGPGPTLTFSVSFLENGLPGGTGWTVLLGQSRASSTGGSVTFPGVSRGSSTFQILSPSGFAASPSDGSVNVSHDVRMLITFQDSSGASSLWPLPPEEALLLSTIGGIGVAGVVFAELIDRRRRRRSLPPKELTSG
jgi:hypothetical protein